MSATFPVRPPPSAQPYLLTPPPLTTAPEVKAAMMCDWGSWDGDFRAMTRGLRAGILALLGAGGAEYDRVPMRGSGTYLVEAMTGTFLPRDGKLLVLANGAYGLRAADIARRIGRAVAVLDKGDYLPPRGAEVARILAEDPGITHVLTIHCETSPGILNPVEEIAEAVAAAGRTLLIDSLSAFGALPLEPAKIPCEAFVSSADKCIEGVPGFGFLVARRDALRSAEGRAHSLSLDAHAQRAYMERSEQWRFTPPPHVVAAFLEALKIHAAEGGIAGRGARYARNRDVLVAGLRGLGFGTLLPDRWLSPIIVTFLCPADPGFDFARFYEMMKARGFILYPGKLTMVESFRIGCIGRIDAAVMQALVAAVAATLEEMGARDAAPPADALAERARAEALQPRPERGRIPDEALQSRRVRLGGNHDRLRLIRADWGVPAGLCQIRNRCDHRRGPRANGQAEMGPCPRHADHAAHRRAMAGRIRPPAHARRCRRGLQDLRSDERNRGGRLRNPGPGRAQRGRRAARDGAEDRLHHRLYALDHGARAAGRGGPGLCARQSRLFRRPARGAPGAAGDVQMHGRSRGLPARGRRQGRRHRARHRRGRGRGLPTVGVSLSGNTVGLTPEEVAALPAAALAERRAAAEKVLFDAGADHVIDTVAELPDLLRRLDAESAAA